MKLITFGKVDAAGKLTLNNERGFKKDLQAFRERNVVLTVERKSKKRSVQQNRYYWGVVVPIIKEGLQNNGYRTTTNETHELLKFRFLKKELVNEDTGEIMTTIKSTTDLSPSMAMDFYAQIQQWAIEYLNCIVPDPNEYLQD